MWERAGEGRVLLALVGLIFKSDLGKTAFAAATISVLAAQWFGDEFGLRNSDKSCSIPTSASSTFTTLPLHRNNVITALLTFRCSKAELCNSPNSILPQCDCHADGY